MKKDNTEIKKSSVTKSGEASANDAELMEQFKEFQAFKAMMANKWIRSSQPLHKQIFFIYLEEALFYWEAISLVAWLRSFSLRTF